MKISVVIPVYNSEKTILRAIESVLKQEQVDELILVDDGSTDKSQSIIQALVDSNAKIKLFQHPNGENRGPSATRNKAIMVSQNEWIAFLDADDYYLPGRFNTTQKVIEKNKNVDGVYEAMGVLVEGGKAQLTTVEENNIPPKELFFKLSPIGSSGRFGANGFTVKKSVLEKIGLFDENLRIGEDVLLWLKCAIAANLLPGNILNPVSLYTREEESLTTNKVVKYYLIEVYKRLLSWEHLNFMRKHRIKIIQRLMSIRLDYLHATKNSLVGIIIYTTYLLACIVKFPYYLCTVEVLLSIKDYKTFFKPKP